MKPISEKDVINNFINYSISYGDYMLKFDYKNTNKMAKKIFKLVKSFSEDRSLATRILSNLMKSNNYVVKSNAAVSALRMNLLIDEAIFELEKVAENKDIGILAFGPQKALEMWKKNGYLD